MCGRCRYCRTTTTRTVQVNMALKSVRNSADTPARAYDDLLHAGREQMHYAHRSSY